MTGFMGLVAITAAIGGFLYGYDTGIISGALLSITDEFKLGHTMQEMVASAILVGATVGGLGSGWFADRYGRRITIIGIGAIFATGAVLASISPNAITLALSRCLLGLAVGGSSQAIPTYIAELSPPDRRGTLVTAFNVAIGVGILAASLVGYFLHGTWSWRWMVSAAAVPAVLMLAAMVFMPETPRWLASKHREDDARASLKRVRAPGDDIEQELKDIVDGTRGTEKSRTRGWRGLLAGWVRPATICGLGVAALTQLSGIEMMIYYAPTILKDAGFGPSSSLLCSIAIAAVYLVMTFIGLQIVDRVGRRRISLLMIPGATVSLLALGALFMLNMAGGGQAWLLIGCLLLYMAFNSGGLQVVGWLTGSEVYPLSVRGAGTSAQAGMVWGADLLVTASALTLVQLLGAGGTMWVYAGMNVVAFAFIWFFVPEISGHSLESIESSLRENKFRPALGRNPGRELQPAGE